MSEVDQAWMAMAERARRTSHDPHHQVGCVAVARDGRHLSASNSVPAGLRCDDPSRLGRDSKAAWIAHAEAHLVCLAARKGIPLEGATVYTTRYPCDACALALIAGGVSEIVSPPPDLEHHRWGRSFGISVLKFREAGIATRQPLRTGASVPDAA